MPSEFDVPAFPKVSLTIAGDLLPRDILPPEGSPGSANAILTFTCRSKGAVLTAKVKARPYRQILKRLDASQYGGLATLQGMLGQDGEVLEAGFALFLYDSPRS